MGSFRPVNSSFYWTPPKFKIRAITKKTDLLKCYGLAIAGGKLLLAGRAKEDSSTLLFAVTQNSTTSRCDHKGQIAPFLICDPSCASCVAGETNHIDSHYLGTEASVRVLYGAVYQYDLISQQRGHNNASIRAEIKKCGHNISDSADLNQVPMSVFKGSQLGIGRNLTLAAGNGRNHATDKGKVMAPSVVNKIEVYILSSFDCNIKV